MSVPIRRQFRHQGDNSQFATKCAVADRGRNSIGRSRLPTAELSALMLQWTLSAGVRVAPP